MNNDKRTISRIVSSIKVLLVGVMVTMTCACNDFLSITPTNEIVLEDFWKNKSDVESAMSESYRLMTQSNFTHRLLVWGEMRSDNVKEGNNYSTDVEHILEANLLPTNSYASWAPFYEVINTCNLVLKYAPGVLDEDPNFTQGDLDMVRGEMLALRALCHFYLVRTFRDVPLLTEAMVDNSQNLYQPQAKPIEVLDQCLKDLYEAEGLVLTSGNHQLVVEGGRINDKNNKGRITKDAVRTMIADVLLWKAAFAIYEAHGDDAVAKACYDECIAYCDLVLDTRMNYVKARRQEKDSKFRLPNLRLDASYPIAFPMEDVYEATAAKSLRFPHKPYSSLFAEDCNHFYESIFEIQHEKKYTDTSGNNEVPYFYGSSFDKERETFTPGVLSATPFLALEGQVYGRTDFRRVNYVFSQSADGREVDKYGIIKYGHSNATESRNADTDKYSFGAIKYKFFEIDGGHFKTDQVNWIVYRVSDVMLMKAEALALRNMGTDWDEAFELVSAIYYRSQSFIYDEVEDNVSIDTPNGEYADIERFKKERTDLGVLRLVLRERQREFAFEGKRWFDLVRYALYTSTDGTTEKMFNDTEMLKNKYTSNESQYRAKMATINSLFFPIAEREMNANSLLVQNDAYKVEDKVQKN